MILHGQNVCMDQGGELEHSCKVVQLIESAGYSIELTVSESSRQNASDERPHRIIGDAVHTM